MSLKQGRFVKGTLKERSTTQASKQQNKKERFRSTKTDLFEKGVDKDEGEEKL